MGEQLLDVVRELGTSKDLLIVAPPQMNDPSYLNAVALAIKFRDRGAGFIFRAIFEGWSKERIIKEMY